MGGCEMNKKIRCIDASDTDLLQVDEVYEVLDETEDFYRLETETGIGGWYKERFEEVEDEE